VKFIEEKLSGHTLEAARVLYQNEEEWSHCEDPPTFLSVFGCFVLRDA
jgi:hypothetical protein